ncbi:hypothetical protein C8R46DRAFT_1078284 [Mycena filopes]|nr:hypothetical protein C8R46DRAFT_1078284 [Mycena filopes]
MSDLSYNPEFSQSQSGQRYNFTTSGAQYDAHGRLLPSSDDEPSLPPTEELLADHLANNYSLDAENRGELEAFSEIARALPRAHYKVALILQATSLQNHQLLREMKTGFAGLEETLSFVRKSLSDNVTLSKDQTGEIAAACRVLFYSGRRQVFDNDALKPELTTYLKKYKATNGLSVLFEDHTQAHSKLLAIHVGRALSGVKSFIRRSLIKSLSDGNANPGCGVTAITTQLAKKCLGGSENAKPQHAIWCLIIRSFIRSDADLRMSPADAADEGDEEFPEELAPLTVPAKRTHSGTVKVQSSDGKIIAAFWSRVRVLFARKNKVFGDQDLKSEGWTNYINSCVAQEKIAYPGDQLAAIVGTDVTPTAASSSSRLSGISSPFANDTVNSRTPIASGSRPHGVHLSTPFGFGGNERLHTPTGFTGGSAGSGIRLPPLNHLAYYNDGPGAART